MPATSHCKPWCTAHQEPNECYTSYCIYDDGKEASEKVEPEPGSLAAQLKAFGGMPTDISWIAFVASQDEEDEQPIMDFHFYEAGRDDPTSRLELDVAVLKELHSNLGDILKDFS